MINPQQKQIFMGYIAQYFISCFVPDVLTRVWSGASDVGFLGRQRSVPSGIENTGISATSPEDCVVHCSSQPACHGVVVREDLFLEHPIYQLDHNNCFFVYTNYLV